MNAHTPNASGSSETKTQKFTRLCEARASRVLEDIRLVAQLNTRAYEHTPMQAEILVKTMGQAVADLARSYAVPFVFKAGRPGKADPTTYIFDAPKSPEMVDTHKGKSQIAKALDLMDQGDLEQARSILTEML